MANKTIDFDEIYAGQKGSEVSQIILENLKKLSARIIELEDKISQIKGSSIDGATVIDNTGSISVQYAPTSVFGKTYPTSQVSYVSVKVTYGTSDLYPGTDDSSLHYSYSLTNSDIMSNGKKIGTVEPVVEYSNLKFKVIISPNTISDSNFSFTITFKGKTYSYTVPIIIMNDNHALNGQSVYTSTVFKRSTLGTPSTPTGGSFDNPIPNGWSDGITGGSGDLYTSHRTFTSDGQPPQSADWSIPVLAQDSADIDFCYSAYTVGRPKSPSELGLPHGSQDSDTSIYHWHDSGTENDVWMAISVKSGNEWGDWSVLKIKGENGINGDWKDVIYKEFDGTSLEAPNIMNPDNFVDLEDSAIRKDDGSVNTEECNKKWKDRPLSSGVWWMSVGTIDGTTNLCQYGWSEPVKVTPIDGVAGAACFMSTVFKRDKSDNIFTPTGGNYSSPVPNDKSWSDGIPADDGSGNPIWESHRRFTSDGKTPQDTSWSTPKLMIDTADFDVCYSANSEIPSKPTTHGVQSGPDWHNEGGENDKWMATSSKRSQGDWTDWTITQIKGENGNNGDWMDYVFKQHSGDTLSAPTINDPNDFASVKEEDDVNFGWLDGPGVGPDWWMSCALIDGTTGKLKGGKWSQPKRLQGEKGADGSYTELKYKVSDNMLNHPPSGATWHDNVLDAYHEISHYDYLLPNYYMWIRQRRYDGTTKIWGEYEYMRVTGEKGEPGTSIAIKGTVNSYYDLFSLSGVTDGDSYMVFGDLWVYNVSNTDIKYDELDKVLQDLYNPDGLPNFPGPGHWRNCGHIIGPSGTSQYLHIKYAEMLDCSGTTTDGKVYLYPSAGLVHNEPDTYIGVLVDSNPEAQDYGYSAYTWSQFTGDDGYGYEYIYKLKNDSEPWDVPTPSSGTCAEYSSDTYQTNDYVPDGWTDTPSGITNEMPYEFMCRREKINKIWQPFTGQAKNSTKASLYSYYGKDAPEQIYEYANFTSYVLTDEMKESKLWQRWVIASTPPGYFLWQRVCTYTPARGSEKENYTEWQYSRITGEKGETGTGLEIQGSMPSYHDLFALSDPDEWSKTHSGTYHDPEDGTCYIVFGHLWSWVASSTEIIYDNLSVKEKEEYQAKYGTTLSQRHWKDGGQIQGPQGISGETAYLHIKFANTARYISGNTYEVTDKEWLTTFATSHDGEAPGRFIGMYTDSNQMDSSEPSKYIWTKYTGDDGLNYEYIYTRTATDDDVDVPVISEEMRNGTDTSKVNVVESINPAGVIKPTIKAYQESDWVPYTGTIVNGNQITKHNWTDNPMGPTEKLPFEWCCKREKSISISGSTALWGAFYGKANDTTKAFLFNKYGDSALQLDMTNQIHGYKRNAYGNCIIETVVCKINVSKDGEPRTITNIAVSGDTKQFQTITPNASDKTVTLINKPNMTSGGILTFKITIDKETYDKTFNYTVTDDGTPGLTIYFDPESIVAEEDIVSGVVSTENTYAHLNVYKDGKQLKYKSGGTLTSDEYSVSITEESSANIRQKILFTYSSDNGRYKFHITNFDVKGTKPYGGTVEFDVVTGGVTYKRALKWMVNWLGFFRQTICGDTMTNIAQNVQREIDDRGLLTISSGQSMFVQSSTGIIGQVSQLSGDVKSLSGTTGSLQLSANSFSTKIEETNGRFSSIEQNLTNLSLKVGNITKSIRPNLLPNTLMSQYISHYACYPPKTIELPGGLYTLSARGRFISQGMINGQTPDYMRIIAYMYDNDWSHSIEFNTTGMLTKSLELNVPNGGSKIQIGWYLGENQYAQIGSKFYLEYLKLESGSGATEYVISNYDSATSNSIVLSPYEVVTKYNLTARDSNYTLTTHSTPEGNYVKIGNSTAISDWQLIYPKEALKLSDFNVYGPTTWYFWCVARNPNAKADDYFNFGSELIHPSEVGTGLMDLTTLISTKNSLQHKIPLSNGWSLYYASVLQRWPAIPQLNLLSHPEMTRKVKKFMFKTFDGGTPSTPNATSMSGFTNAASTSVNYGWQEKPTSFTNLWCSYCTATYTSSGWVFSSWSTPSEINGNSGNNIYYALGSSPKNAPLHNENWNTDPKEAIKPNTTIPSGMYLWRKFYESGSYSYECLNNADDDWKWSGVIVTSGNMNGGVATYTVSSLPNSESPVELLKQDITNALAPGRWYTLSFKAKDSSNNKGYVHTYMYSTDGNTVGDNTNSEKGYVTIGNVTTHLTSIVSDNYYRWQFSDTENTYSYTFKVPTTWTKEKPSYLLFRVTSNDSKGKAYDLSISNIKLEQCSARTRYNESEQNRKIYLGFNTVHGTWDILDAGISKYGIPSISSINSKLEAANQRTALLDTGIDIENRKVTITSDNFTVQNNEGNQTFLIDEFGKVNVNVLNADEILTNALSAKTINANSATFTNIKIAGESSFGGLMKKTKTIITEDNILDYAGISVDDDGVVRLNVVDLEKLGTWVEIQGFPANRYVWFGLPTILGHVSYGPDDIDKLDYARSLVGNTLIITNKASRYIRIIGCSTKEGVGPDSLTGVSVEPGETALCECKMNPYAIGGDILEEVYWECVVMKTTITQTT